MEVRWTIAWAVAATVLAIALAAQRAPPWSGERVVPSHGWGWAKPGALPAGQSRTHYLNSLADCATDWFQSQPESVTSLALRLGEFRQGCSILILSENRPLAGDDTTWLVESCRAWSATFDGYLIALEAGGDPLIIRHQADRTIESVVASLRKRARSE
jgi:hypothetical protein